MLINGKKLREIKELIETVKNAIYLEDKYDACDSLLKDAELMHSIISGIRDDVHTTEDADDFCLGVAEDLGTNCEPGLHPDEDE